MNKLNIYKGLLHLAKSKSNRGFTLIELLVVVIIIGILAAVTLPNTLKQAAKAREAEGKSNLGILSRAQQAHHFESRSFTNSIADLFGNAVISSQYFTFPNPTVANNSIVKHQAIATNPANDQVRNFALGVYFDSGVYDVAMCQSSNVNVAVDAPNTVSDTCTNGGERLR